MGFVGKDPNLQHLPCWRFALLSKFPLPLPIAGLSPSSAIDDLHTTVLRDSDERS